MQCEVRGLMQPTHQFAKPRAIPSRKRDDVDDWNCQQHIIPRFTEEEIRDVLAPVEKRVGELEKENERLKKEVARLTAAKR
jgi:hypothetical protein